MALPPRTDTVFWEGKDEVSVGQRLFHIDAKDITCYHIIVVWSCTVALWIEILDRESFSFLWRVRDLLSCYWAPSDQHDPVPLCMYFSSHSCLLASRCTSAAASEVDRNCPSVPFTQTARWNISSISTLKGLCERGFDDAERHTASSFVPDIHASNLDGCWRRNKSCFVEFSKITFRAT